MSGPARPSIEHSAARPGLGPVIFLVGPTGAGKTAVALDLARPLGAEILSVDSRAAYRRLERGTAKPTAVERATAAHHLLDLYEPAQTVSAGAFRERFLEVSREIQSRGVRALAVGGSGLYVDACLGRLDRLPPADAAVREAHARIAARDPAELHRRLQGIDPESAMRLSPNDVQRVSRALEVFEVTGVRMSRLQTIPRGPLDVSKGPPMIILSRSRTDLYGRIERRAQAMIAAGLPDEVRRLIEAGVRSDAPGMEAIGYAEFARAAAGEISADEAAALFIQATRRYAKRQETWFRNRYSGAQVIAVPPSESSATTAARVMASLSARWGREASGSA